MGIAIVDAAIPSLHWPIAVALQRRVGHGHPPDPNTGHPRPISSPLMTPEPSPPVLIVEDDAGIRTMLELALAERGVATVSAATLADALRAARDLRPKLVLLDLRLDGADGGGFVSAFGDRASTAIVIMTASEEAAAAAARLGADGYLEKPFGLGALYALVERFVGRGRG